MKTPFVANMLALLSQTKIGTTICFFGGSNMIKVSGNPIKSHNSHAGNLWWISMSLLYLTLHALHGFPLCSLFQIFIEQIFYSFWKRRGMVIELFWFLTLSFPFFYHDHLLWTEGFFGVMRVIWKGQLAWKMQNFPIEPLAILFIRSSNASYKYGPSGVFICQSKKLFCYHFLIQILGHWIFCYIKKIQNNVQSYSSILGLYIFCTHHSLEKKVLNKQHPFGTTKNSVSNHCCFYPIFVHFSTKLERFQDRAVHKAV